jgi:hypothetical protein
VVVLLLPLIASSCFTAALWGFFPEEDRIPVTGATEATFEYDPETEWSWGLFGKRLLLTPFTVVLDCVTCPVQAFLFEWDDDCERPRRQ